MCMQTSGTELHTCDGFNVGNIKVPTGGQSSKECCDICGALKALTGLLVTLTVVNLQVYHRPASRKALRFDDYYSSQ